MKQLLVGTAIVAALAFSASSWAQPANPSGGNPMGMPGPSPGGPGLTPYSTGAPATPAVPGGPTGRGFGPKASGGNYVPSAAPPASSMSDTSSAMPPKHRRARGKAAHHPSRFPNVQGNNVANELNQAELARLQSGNFTPPPAPPAPDMTGAPATGSPRTPGRMSTGGRATSGGRGAQ
jgi:hypothetical protein